MSINYNDALSPYDNKGAVGMVELSESEEELDRKVSVLASLLTESKCCFVIMGAGVSTAAGIADFRGPNGVWTMEKEGKNSASIDFLEAKPTLTHYALVALEKAGILKWMVSQNVDGLCGRSGFPMDRLAELHGNVFCEKCDRCGRMYYRPFAIPTVGGKLTGRYCDGTPQGRRCRGRLIDFTLDWEGELPEPQYTTSCKNGGKIVTVNLQKTKHEKKADLAIHAKVDQVMAKLMAAMGLSIDHLKEVPIDEPILESAHPMFKFEEKKKNKRMKKEEIKEEEETEEKKVKKEEENQETSEEKIEEEKSEVIIREEEKIEELKEEEQEGSEEREEESEKAEEEKTEKNGEIEEEKRIEMNGESLESEENKSGRIKEEIDEVIAIVDEIPETAVHSTCN